MRDERQFGEAAPSTARPRNLAPCSALPERPAPNSTGPICWSVRD